MSPAGESPSQSGGIDLSVVVPTYAEVANIRALVQRVFEAGRGAGLSLELIIVDDNSGDGTAELCAALACEYNLALITRHSERGLATAVLLGLSKANGRFLLSMDADLSHPPEAIPQVVRALRDGADFVLGSRYVPGAGVEEGWGFLRWLNSKVATLLARPLVRVSDPLSGYFALPRTALRDARDLSPLGYKIALELLVKIAPKRIVEVPIRFKDRVAGQSKLSLRVQIQYLRHLRRLYQYRYPFLSELGQFGLVGGLGVLVDVVVYSALESAFGLNHLAARALSFLAAASHNWLLNRRYTFVSGRSHAPTRQWASYLLVMVVGFVVNFGTYAVLTTRTAYFGHHRYVALLLGIAVGTVFNFAAARSWVFRRRSG